MSHTVESSYVISSQFGPMYPALICSCGFAAKGESWQEAGSRMDFHLEGIKLPEGQSSPTYTKDGEFTRETERDLYGR